MGESMGKRRVRKMLRDMAGGRPVKVTSRRASVKELGRLACIAEQFGYAYSTAAEGGGMQGSGITVLLVPDLGQEGRDRAARNQARYPDAADGGRLPTPESDDVDLLRARIRVDLARRFSEGQGMRALLGFVVATGVGVALGKETGVYAGVLAWLVVAVTFFAGVVVNRRAQARFAAVLLNAGYTAVTDPQGRLRYLPPGGRLPGHGNPFADGS
jgi:hypothetical protein